MKALGGTGLGAIFGGAIPSVVGYALGKKMDKKTAIAPASAAAMPDPDDAAISAARRRRLAQMQTRGGRQSTILSQNETLGGG